MMVRSREPARVAASARSRAPLIIAIFALVSSACSGGNSSGEGLDAGGRDARRLFDDAGGDASEPREVDPRDDAEPSHADARTDAGGEDARTRDAATSSTEEMEGIDEQTNDDFTSAEDLAIGAAISGAIGNPIADVFDVDVFQFPASTGDIFQITITPGPASMLQPSITAGDEAADYQRYADSGGDVAPVTRQIYVDREGPLAIFVNDVRNTEEPPAVVGGADFTYLLELQRVTPVVEMVALPVARAASMFDGNRAVRVLAFDGTAADDVFAETFAVRLTSPSDADTILALEDRSGAAPVVLAINDDIDTDNNNTDSRIDATLANGGPHRFIVDHFSISGPDTSYELELGGGGGMPMTGALVINEVDYDNVGSDSAEFVELYNATNAAVSLGPLVLVFINGANDTEYRRVALSDAGATLAAGEYLVVAMNGVTVAPSALVIRDAATAQNGPDGVAIFDTTAGMVIDALSYEGAITAAMISGATGSFDLVEGTASPESDIETMEGSISRCPNGTDSGDAASDWSFVAMPSPGSTNVCP